MLRGSPGEAEASSVALWKLARNGDNRASIAKADGIPALVAVVEKGTAAAKEKAARALWDLGNYYTYGVLIASAGAIPPLVALLQKGTDEVKGSAAAALGALGTSNDDNKASIAKAGPFLRSSPSSRTAPPRRKRTPPGRL